jgi:hypothetical protein
MQERCEQKHRPRPVRRPGSMEEPQPKRRYQW